MSEFTRDIEDLYRIYLFSDCFGGNTSDPARSPDPDALISTDLRSAPLDLHHREFDTFDRPGISDHILRLALRLHDELQACTYLSDEEKARVGTTGIMVNSAPRTTPDDNGDEFYLAGLKSGKVRIAAPLHALSAVGKDIENLVRIPNDANGLYRNAEQFRSSFIARILRTLRGIKYEQVDPSVVPEYPKGWRVSYVDRFKNLVTYSNNGEARGIGDLTNGFRLQIGDVIQNVVRGVSLAATVPGEIAVYGNDGNIDVIRKWEPGESPNERLERAASERFGRPTIGSPVKIVK